MSRVEPSGVLSVQRAGWLPVCDIGLAALAAIAWYLRPQLGLWPLGFIAVAWLLRRVAYGYLTRTTPLDFPLLVFLFSALTSAAIAYNQGSQWVDTAVQVMWAWSKFWYIVVALALFYAIANLRSVNQVWWFLRGYTLLGVVVTIYYMLTFDWTSAAAKFSVLNRIAAWLTAPLPHLPLHSLQPNVAGGIIAMLLPFCAALLLEARAAQRRNEVLYWGLVGLVLLFGLLFSESRGAWLALALMSGIWLLARSLGGWLYRRTTAWPRPMMALVALSLIAALCLALLAFAYLALTSSPTAFLGANVQSGRVSRLDVFGSSWPLAQDYFFTGAGLASFPLLYSAYSLLIPVVFLPNSHNLFLDILIEQGIFGLLSYVWLLAVFAGFVLYSLRALAVGRQQNDPATTRRLRWVLEASLVSAAIAIAHGMVEDVPYGSVALLLLFVPPAATLALQRYFPPPRLPLSSRWVGVGIGLFALTLLWQRQFVLSSLYANLGALAQAQVELSGYYWPDRLPEHIRKDGDLSGAVTDFSRALSFDAGNRTANQRLGAIALERGAYDHALRYLESAYARDPTNATTWQLLGDAYLALGRLDDAYTYWSRVDNAADKLQVESWARYERYGDRERAGWALTLAEKIRAAQPEHK